MHLSPLEARIIGALLEKELTTPDQYPLTLNSLITACNQKSNRDPVISLTESDVQNVLDDLIKKGMVSEVVFGSRVAKFKHRFCNTEFSQLHLNSKELACLCIMFLRGAQTPGELRTRANRLCLFADVTEVDATLAGLMNREGDPLVVKLEREPGKREARYMHLFYDDETFNDVTVSLAPGPTSRNNANEQEERIVALEELVQEMRIEIGELRQLWDDLNA